MRVVLPCLALIFAGACQPAAPPAADAAHDTAADAAHDAAADATSDAAGDAADAAAPTPARGELVQLDLSDGSAHSGELIAVYDCSRWWHDARAELIYGLFDPTGFAPVPDDASVALISSLDVRRLTTLAWPVERQTYRDLLRGQGIVLERPPLDGTAFVITGHDRYHPEEDGYGDFAWDLVRTDADGARFTGTGAANADYLVWGAEVYLPTGGTVIDAVDEGPDNVPGAYPEDAINNMVGVHLGGSYYLYLLHLMQGSVPEEIQPGQHLDAGAYLGRVGNAGVSLEPHLHLVLLWWDAGAEPPRSWSVPAEMVEVEIAPSPAGPFTRHAYADPATGTWLRAAGG